MSNNTNCSDIEQKIYENIEKEICKRIDTYQESLKYVIEAICEIQSGLHNISYLLYLSKKISNKQD